jgi:hypothetical protein
LSLFYMNKLYSLNENKNLKYTYDDDDDDRKSSSDGLHMCHIN